MSTQFNERNISMVMDMYELTMANGYFHKEYQDTIAAFDVFYRNNPDNAGFAIFAGLEQVIEYIENLHFSEEDIEYLRSKNLFRKISYSICVISNSGEIFMRCRKVRLCIRMSLLSQL